MSQGDYILCRVTVETVIVKNNLLATVLSSSYILPCTLKILRQLIVQHSLMNLMLYMIRCSPCTLFMVLYLCRMRQCGLQAVLQSPVGIRMRLLAVESNRRSSKQLISLSRKTRCSRCFSRRTSLFRKTFIPSQYLRPKYSLVWHWRVLRAGPMLFSLA